MCVQAGTYLPQSYLVHEEMVVTRRLENIDQLGYFIYNLCRGKETYNLQRRDRVLGETSHSAPSRLTCTPFIGRSRKPCTLYLTDKRSVMFLGVNFSSKGSESQCCSFLCCCVPDLFLLLLFSRHSEARGPELPHHPPL